METKLTSGTNAVLVKNESENITRGLVIIPDIMNLRPLFIDMAKHLSEIWSANVCTFDVFPEHTFESADHETTLQNHYKTVSKLDDARIFADTKSAAELTEGSTLGLIGFCLGGMYTLKTMTTGVFNKGVAFYPQIKIPQEWVGPKHREPLELFADNSTGKAGAEKTMAVLGTIDHYTPPEDIEALTATGVKTQIYEGCDHGFVHDPDRPAHQPKEAADAWRQAEAFLFG